MELKMRQLRFVNDFQQNASFRKWAIGIGLAGSVGVAVVSAVGQTTAPSVATTAPTTRTATTAPSSTTTARQSDNNRNYGRDSNGRNRNGRRDNNQPAAGPNVVNSNDPYSVPPTSSIFVKGNQELVSTVRIEPRRDPPVNPTGIGGGRDTNLIFNGVTIVDDKPAAFVEDIQANVVGIVKPGDAVAGGTVTTITFHDLEYIVHGQTKHVTIGQDFSGNAAVTASVGTITAMPTPLSTNNNNGGPQIIGNGASIPTTPAAGGPTGMSTQDILARMKARKEQEAKQMSSH